jgi:tight adherence protein B
MAAFLALVVAAGVFFLYTAVALGWRGVGIGPAAVSTGGASRWARWARRSGDWLAQAGLEGVRVRSFAAVMAALSLAGALAAWTLFGAPLPALVAGLFAASFPPASYRARRARRRADANDAWPRLIEEIRLQTSSLGRSVPQALFDVGRRAPEELRGAFAVAEREWLLTTDLARTVVVLKQRLADATADAALETLLVAHQVGGSDLDRRLAALREDRVQDVQGRKDARAKQAGVRFARRFVLVVPAGMALAGLSIGTGRAAYQTPAGQLAVVLGLLVVVACWAWAGRLLRLPEEERVFHG